MTNLDPHDAPAEPLVTVGVITAFATAILALLVAFAVPLSAGQQTAILGVLATAVPIVTALWGRLKVFSPRTVARLTARR